MLRPLGKRILVKLLEEKRESSLLIVPDTEGNIRQAIVLASGVVDVKVGDTVLVNSSGAISASEGKLVAEANVLGVLE